MSYFLGFLFSWFLYVFARAHHRRHNPKNYNTYVMINLLLVDVGQAGKAWAPPPCPTSTSYKFNVDISNSRKKGVLAGLCPSSSPSLNYFMSTLIQGSAGRARDTQGRDTPTKCFNDKVLIFLWSIRGTAARARQGNQESHEP